MRYCFAALLLFALLGCDEQTAPTPSPSTGTKDGIAVAILLDVSPSMTEPVAGLDNKVEAKNKIAKEALISLMRRAEDFDKRNPTKNLQVSIYEFSSGCKQVMRYSKPSVSDAESSITNRSGSGTAIGEAIRQATAALYNGGYKQRHVIVITDGESNTGVDPALVASEMSALSGDKKIPVYLVAFDVSSNIFKPLKDAGWMVVPAANAVELQGALDTIVGENILLER